MNISENLQRILQDKFDMAAAITEKGVECSVDDSLDIFAEKILQISGGEPEPIPDIPDTDPLTFIKVDKFVENGSISLAKNGSAPAKTFEYNKNDSGWQTYTEGDKIPMKYGDKVQFRSSSTQTLASSETSYRNFITLGLFKCGGNILSLTNNQ